MAKELPNRFTAPPQAIRAAVWNHNVPHDVDDDVIEKATAAASSINSVAVKMYFDNGAASEMGERWRYVGKVPYADWSEEVTALQGKEAGTYKCEVVGTTGKLRGTVRQFLVGIGPSVIDALPAAGSPASTPAALPAPSTMSIEQMFLAMLQASNQQQMKSSEQMTQVLVALLSRPQTPAPTADPMMATILSKLLDGALKGPEKTPMSELREMAEFVSKHTGQGDDDEDKGSDSSTIAEVVKLARAFLEKAGQAQPAAPATPAALPSGHSTAAIIHQAKKDASAEAAAADAPSAPANPTPTDEKALFKRWQDKSIETLRDAAADLDGTEYLTAADSVADVIGASARRLGIDVKSFVGTDVDVVASFLILEAPDLESHKGYIVDVLKALQDLYADDEASPTTATPTAQ